jgi:hypothetical protein
MAADQNTVCFFDLYGASAKDQVNDAGRRQVRWYSQDVQRRKWTAAHGINVRQGICGCDLSICKRIIDDWSEEIGRLHQRAISVDAIYPCIISGEGTNQEIAAIQDW